MMASKRTAKPQHVNTPIDQPTPPVSGWEWGDLDECQAF